MEQLYSHIKKDNLVWCKNPKVDDEDPEGPPYIIGKIINIDFNQKYIEVTTLNNKVRFNQTLPYLNNENIEVPDLLSLEKICEMDILNNLSNRLMKNNEIFTNIGPILLIVNPFKKDPTLYSNDKIEYFIKKHIQKPPIFRNYCEDPHLFDFILIIIEKLLNTKINQCILFNGESGSGKSETVKDAMICIIYYFQGLTEEQRKQGFHGFHNRLVEEPIEKKLLSANAILESFGNRKTVKNDNSSCFGKYIKINIDTENSKIKSAKIFTYLLEKNRVIFQPKNERNFHIFYQLLYGAGPNTLEKLHLINDPSKYKYLNNSGCLKIKGIDDTRGFKETHDCFSFVGFEDDEFDCILKIISTIILLGNINFIKGNKELEIEDMSIAGNICDLLDCKIEDLLKMLTMSTKIVNEKEIEYKLSLNEACEARDNFACDLYIKLFNWIITRLNSELDPDFLKNQNDDPNNIKFIGILDFPGFDDFNSLHQLCVNYVNEKLINLYINHFFISEIEDFNGEELGSKLSLFKFKNNQPIIDLIELSPNGIFQKLEDCTAQNRDDEYFINILKKNLSSNKFISLPKSNKDLNISIKHTVKEISYNCMNFTEKNKDEINKNIITLMGSLNKLEIKFIYFNVSNEYEILDKIEKLNETICKKNNNTKFYVGKLKNDIQKLTKELKSCRCNFIRCLKPNEQKKEYYVTQSYLFHQILYFAMIDTINIIKNGFPYRIEYKILLEQFIKLFPELKSEKLENSQKTSKIFEILTPETHQSNEENWNSQFLLGNTKVFMKHEYYILLQNASKKLLNKKIEACNTIKIGIKHLLKKAKLEKVSKNILYIQKFLQINKNKFDKKDKIEKICKIQSLIKAYNSVQIINGFQSHYVDIQTIFKTIIAQKNYELKLFKLDCLSMRLHMFLGDLRKRRREKIKVITKNLIRNIVDKIIWNEYKVVYENIKVYIHSLLARKRNQLIYQTAKYELAVFNKNKVIHLMQMNMLFKKVRDRREGLKIIHKNFITTYSSSYFFKLREYTLIIQNYLTRYLNQKKVITTIINNYFLSENNDKLNTELKLYSSIYPIIKILKQNKSINNRIINNQEIIIDNNSSINNVIYMKNRKKLKPCSSMKKIDTLNIINSNHKKFIRSSSSKILNNCSSCTNFNIKDPFYFSIGNDFLQKNPEMNSKLALVEPNVYKDHKITFFARILAIDLLMDINDIYNTDWGEEFQKIYEKNSSANTPIQLISVGESNTMLVNSLGKVYTFGWNNNCQCGINNKDSVKNYILPDITYSNNINNEKNKIQKFPIVYYENTKNLSLIYGITANYINLFNESSFILNDKGDCYAFGNNSNGQLGLGNPFPVETPTLIKLLKGQIKCIKNCQDFTIVLTNDLEIFLWYCQSKNKIMKIKLNKQKNINKNYLFTTEESKEFNDFLESGINYGIPFKINFIDKKIKIKEIACGYNFCMLLSKNGLLFGLGCNKNGELGLTPNKEEIEEYFYSPVQNIILTEFYEEKIISVKCGFKHTICLSSGKKVYAWGNNKYGQLGLNNYENQIIPIPINFNNFLPIEKIIQIQAGFRSTIFWTENRNIFYTGILDADNQSKFPVKFDTKIKSPEICAENKFAVVRIMSSWSKNMSIFYATIADNRGINQKNKKMNLLNKVLDILSKNWDDENVLCPKMESISNFISTTFMRK